MRSGYEPILNVSKRQDQKPASERDNRGHQGKLCLFVVSTRNKALKRHGRRYATRARSGGSRRNLPPPPVSLELLAIRLGDFGVLDQDDLDRRPPEYDRVFVAVNDVGRLGEGFLRHPAVD